MKSRTLALLLFVVFASFSSLQAQARQGAPPPIGATDVAVAVNYTGKGVVDAGHSIIVFLFAEPNVGPDSRPLGPPLLIQKNGGTVTFNGVTEKKVYIFAIYNEKGTYTGRTGPPPAGTPVAFYGTAAGPKAVTPGMKTPVKMTFTGAKKWGQ